MYEELMSRYKGLKHLLSVPVGPFVTAYFQGIFRKHLDSIQQTAAPELSKVDRPLDPTM
jgi:hypothetical protein